jgi:hypothetical protein
MNSRMLILLIPCIYRIKSDLGRLGSGFLMYKYSAICLSTPIKKLHHKDTVSKGCLSGRRVAAELVLFFQDATTDIKTFW